MSDERPILAIVALHLRDADDLEVALRSLVSLRMTAPEAAVLVVDDASPETYVADLEVALAEVGAELVRLDERGGQTAAMNVGLSGALEYGFDAVLVDGSIEFRTPGWLERMMAREDRLARPAAVVGGRLLDSRGLLWHAGIYLSMLRLEWFHRFQYGPGDLWGCVGRWFSGRWRTSAALQYIGDVQYYLSIRIWTTADFLSY